MVSSALQHFPPVLFQNGERVLWNQVLRKPLANRPEERVRLRYLDFLLMDMEWPRTRIAIESTLPSTSNDRFRADLICYSKSLDPSVLIECKADSVRLDESAALQIARYNRSLNAPHLCITNGLSDFWFEITEGKPLYRPAPDWLVEAEHFFNRSAEYWQLRGFMGKRSSQELSEFLYILLNRFWGEAERPSGTYLTFQIGFQNIPFDHYYRIFKVPESGQLAVTFTGTPNGETYLVAFLNVERVNKGFLIVSLDKLFCGDPESSLLVSRGSAQPVETMELLFPDTSHEPGLFIDNLPLNVYELFLDSL